MEKHFFQEGNNYQLSCKVCGEIQVHTNHLARRLESGASDMPAGLGSGLGSKVQVFNSQTAPPHDPVTAPFHYLQTKITPLAVIEDWKLNYHLSSVIKYVGRHKHKGKPLEDLKKAQWYLSREIKLMEEQFNG